MVALFWYNADSIYRLNHDNYLDLIGQYIDWETGLLYPALSGIIYITAIPLIGWLYDLWKSYINKLKSKTLKFVSKGGYIKTEKFLESTEAIQQQKVELEGIINNEKKKTLALTSEISKKEKLILELQDEQRLLKMRSDGTILNGVWKFGGRRLYKNSLITPDQFEIRIENYSIYKSIADDAAAVINNYFYVPEPHCIVMNLSILKPDDLLMDKVDSIVFQISMLQNNKQIWELSELKHSGGINIKRVSS